MCIVIIYLPVCDVIDFGTNLSFLIKTFPYTTKKSGQKFKRLENEYSFQNKKTFFTIFKGHSDARNCLKPEGGPLKENISV